MNEPTTDSPAEIFDTIRARMSEVVVGQHNLIDRLILALLCDGHVLVEGIPGIAKTLTVNILTQALDANFNRIQFTPDLLPGDLLGTQIFHPDTGTFSTEKGPIFTNILLADEINRSPAKVQSALLEAMQEHQVSLGRETYTLPEPFLVLATQNPIEQEGTYELPEAQVDRFMFKVLVGYPEPEEEQEILRRMSKSKPQLSVEAVTTLDAVIRMRGQLDELHFDTELEAYILRLIQATRNPAAVGLADIADYIRFGASPRATIYLARAARGVAFMQGRDSVLPEDIQSVAPDILRHRIALSYKADAANVRSDDLIDQLLRAVPVRT